MGQATLNVGGRRYELSCRDGEEARFAALAAMVDAKAIEAARAVGTVNESRQLLLAALLLADELSEARAAPGALNTAIVPAVDALAERLERLATRLENDAATS